MSGNPRTRRPSRVLRLRGLVFQYDGRDVLSDWLIHPFEQVDRRLAGVRPHLKRPAGLAVHVGLHLEAEVDGELRELVAEQLFGQHPAAIIANCLVSGLHWTPPEDVARRDHGGWHVSVPATAFRAVDEDAIEQALERLQRIRGRPFLAEDCVGFVERAFDGRPLFADSPVLRALGLGIRVGDPALPLLRADAQLDLRAGRLLRREALRALPYRRGVRGSLSAARAIFAVILAIVAGLALASRLPRAGRIRLARV